MGSGPCSAGWQRTISSRSPASYCYAPLPSRAPWHGPASRCVGPSWCSPLARRQRLHALPDCSVGEGPAAISRDARRLWRRPPPCAFRFPSCCSPGWIGCVNKPRRWAFDPCCFPLSSPISCTASSRRVTATTRLTSSCWRLPHCRSPHLRMHRACAPLSRSLRAHAAVSLHDPPHQPPPNCRQPARPCCSWSFSRHLTSIS